MRILQLYSFGQSGGQREIVADRDHGKEQNHDAEEDQQSAREGDRIGSLLAIATHPCQQADAAGDEPREVEN